MYLKQCMVASRVEFFKGDIQEIIKSHKTIKQWAYNLTPTIKICACEKRSLAFASLFILLHINNTESLREEKFLEKFFPVCKKKFYKKFFERY